MDESGKVSVMKYICYFELDEDDLDSVIPKFQEMIKLRESEDFPSGITPTYWLPGVLSGFTLYDVDDPQQITNHYLHYFPEMRLKWESIIEATDFIKTYMKKKKG
jgi:hypothetical protein